MTNNPADKTHNKLDIIDFLVILFSVYVLLALIADTLLKLPKEVSRLLDLIDNGICVFFIVEFFIRLYKAENKLEFLKWGWIDLLGSIPNFDYARIGRALRLIRLLRILRAFRSAKFLINHIFKNKPKGTLTLVFLLAIVVIIFSSIAILQVETDANSNIKTAEDALWWSYTTITTVGYGDKFPVTSLGRLIAVALMTVGVGLFGTFTAFVSSWIVKSEK